MLNRAGVQISGFRYSFLLSDILQPNLQTLIFGQLGHITGKSALFVIKSDKSRRLLSAVNIDDSLDVWGVFLLLWLYARQTRASGV